MYLYSLDRAAGGYVSGEGITIIDRDADNRNPVIEVAFPALVVDRLFFAVPWRKSGSWEIAEFEVYGAGYVPYAAYQSRVFELDAESSLGELQFSGFKDLNATVRIRTRSGRDADPHRYWRQTGRGDEATYRNPDGTPMTRDDWLQLAGGKVADPTVDLDNWNDWSPPYAYVDHASAPIVSPGPRRYFQVQVEFLTAGQDGCGLDVLEFEVTHPPVAGQVVGEIWPARAKPGEETPFTYALLPRFTGSESGFDQLLLQTSGQFTRVDSVHIVGVPAGWELAEPLEDGRVLLRLGERLERADRGKVIEVFFHARVFHYGTVFSGRVFDSERPVEVGQYVEAGDATFQMDSNRPVVDVDLGSRFVGETAALPRVFTPDGDGVNDLLTIRYTVLLLAGGGDVRVDILDLSGRRVAEVYRDDHSSGRYQQTWDGRGSSGKVVPPGIYLYRVRLHLDAEAEEHGGVFSVVY